MEPRQGMHHQHGEQRRQRVVTPRVGKIHAEPHRARDAPQPVLAASERRPPKRDRVGQRRERQRQQRKIDTAPAQHQEADQHRCHEQEREREQCRPQHRAAEPMPLRERRRIGTQAEPRAVAERDQAGLPDQHVERHAGDRENDHIGGAGEREPAGEQRKGKAGARQRRDQGRRAQRDLHSKRWIRSPNSPRGRNNSTSSISRYIDASAAGGKK